MNISTETMTTYLRMAELSILVTQTTEHAVQCEYHGHVNSFNVTIFEGGYKFQPAPEQLHEDWMVKLSDENLPIIESVIEKLEGYLK
jgi:hypothetical protein